MSHHGSVATASVATASVATASVETGPVEPGPVEDLDTQEVTGHLVRLARLIQVARSRFVLSPGQERDGAAYLVLQALARLGPLRQRALAEALRADPSTLSRQVTFLVERELVRRRADDSDGRACVLELTDHGAEKVAQLRQLRERAVGDLLAGWTPADRAAFSRLMARFVDELGVHLDSAPPARTSPDTAPEPQSRSATL